MRTFSAAALLSSAILMLAAGVQAQPAEPTDPAQPLRGGHENPPVISDGTGQFFANVMETAEGVVQEIQFQLQYDVAEGASDAQQAHIHIANPGNNGDIVVFLCSNGQGPSPRPCPPSPGMVNGQIVAADVLAVTEGTGPGAVTIIEAGDLDGLAKLMADGATYVNVHTNEHPAGEVRGQINPMPR